MLHNDAGIHARMPSSALASGLQLHPNKFPGWTAKALKQGEYGRRQLAMLQMMVMI